MHCTDLITTNSPFVHITRPFCDFTKRCRIDRKITQKVSDLKRINFINLYYSFIFQQSLIKICQLFWIIRRITRILILCIYCMKYGHFFGQELTLKKGSFFMFKQFSFLLSFPDQAILKLVNYTQCGCLSIPYWSFCFVIFHFVCLY